MQDLEYNKKKFKKSRIILVGLMENANNTGRQVEVTESQQYARSSNLINEYKECSIGNQVISLLK